MSVIDLDRWHHASTGQRQHGAAFNKATTDDLARWAKALREIASEMEAEAQAVCTDGATEVVFQ
jgi:hypothetical protein